MKKIIILIILLLLLYLIGFSKEPGKKKFQLEVFGGFSTLNPEDLNFNANLRGQIMKFWYEDRYAYYVKVGHIQSNVTNQEGEFCTIKSALPLGLRFKYFVIRPLAISLGFKYLARSAKSNIRHNLTISENDGTQITYTREYSPFNISAEAFIPTLGIHFEKRLSDRMGAEIFVCGGPLFGRCKYSYDYRYEKRTNGNATSTSSVELEEKGSGTGIALDGGIRMNYSISKHLGLFVETGYAYRVVEDLEGPGYTKNNGEAEKWEDEWGMKTYYQAEYWGIVDSIYASNSWEFPKNYLWVRDFKLDLSGFQARIGIAYRF